MAYEVRVGERWVSTDDLTLDDAEAIEAASGIGWGLLNPIRSATAAKALLAFFLVRDGVSDEEAQAQVKALRMKTAKHMFRYVEDDDLPDQWEDGLPVVDPKPETVEPSTG